MIKTNEKEKIYSTKHQNESQPKKVNKITKEVFDLIEMIVCTLVVVTLTFTFVFRIVGVQGVSMIYTLNDQDRLIISNFFGFYEPEVGDIVVLSVPGQFDEPIIKRIIATQGQTINISDEGKVFVDGTEINEPYIHDKTDKKQFNTYPLVVPEGHVFIMGDNRSNSRDSRAVGCINIQNIMGKAVFRIFPLNKIGGT